jgi:hypothetical protein
VGNILLHHPWFHLYLLYAGAWCVVYLWDYLGNAPADRDGARTPSNGEVRGGHVGPLAGITTRGALRAAAPTSDKRRDHHVVTP